MVVLVTQKDAVVTGLGVSGSGSGPDYVRGSAYGSSDVLRTSHVLRTGHVNPSVMPTSMPGSQILILFSFSRLYFQVIFGQIIFGVVESTVTHHVIWNVTQ